MYFQYIAEDDATLHGRILDNKFAKMYSTQDFSLKFKQKDNSILIYHIKNPKNHENFFTHFSSQSKKKDNNKKNESTMIANN